MANNMGEGSTMGMMEKLNLENGVKGKELDG
jgi:hypothetical protein